MIAQVRQHSTQPPLRGFRPSGNMTWETDTGDRPYLKLVDPEPIAATAHGFDLADPAPPAGLLSLGVWDAGAGSTASFIVAGRQTPSVAELINNAYRTLSDAQINYGTSVILVGQSQMQMQTGMRMADTTFMLESGQIVMPAMAINFGATSSGYILQPGQVVRRDLGQMVTAVLWNYDAASTHIDTSTLAGIIGYGDAKDDPFEGYESYAAENWDGFGAAPVASETLACARHVFGSLPVGAGDAHIAPGADGSVGLYWSFDAGPLRSLCIDVGPGLVWRAYWQRRDGRFGHTSCQPCNDQTSEAIAELFKELEI
jgi:hypothetical protein